jgi:uncharacterized protein (TIGR02453 family)
MGGKSTHFQSEFFGFLGELANNNNRDWFQANKERYERAVQEPCLRFIRDAGVRLRSISPHLVADARPFGGSLSRIYRDTRFSPDKSPYKTHVAIHFWHAKGRGPGHTSPGLYVYLEAGGSFVGSGIWHPDAPTLKKVRDRIVSDVDGWRAVRRIQVPIEGESLKRVPPGYDPDHPFAIDLRRKDFVTMVRFDNREVTSQGFLDEFVAACRAMNPLNWFLAEAIGVPW